MAPYSNFYPERFRLLIGWNVGPLVDREGLWCRSQGVAGFFSNCVFDQKPSWPSCPRLHQPPSYPHLTVLLLDSIALKTFLSLSKYCVVFLQPSISKIAKKQHILFQMCRHSRQGVFFNWYSPKKWQNLWEKVKAWKKHHIFLCDTPLQSSFLVGISNIFGWDHLKRRPSTLVPATIDISPPLKKERWHKCTANIWFWILCLSAQEQ